MFHFPLSYFGVKNGKFEALKQLLALLDINPDEIKDEIYATAFRILFYIIEKQNEEIEFIKADNQKLRDEINLLKGEQTKPNIRGSKKKVLEACAIAAHHQSTDIPVVTTLLSDDARQFK